MTDVHVQITFPNGVFSGTIISSVIHDGDIKRTAEWQLLLGAIALPGVFIGALLCNPLGRRNTVSVIDSLGFHPIGHESFNLDDARF